MWGPSFAVLGLGVGPTLHGSPLTIHDTCLSLDGPSRPAYSGLRLLLSVQNDGWCHTLVLPSFC